MKRRLPLSKSPRNGSKSPAPPTEHAEQSALITWATMSSGKHPELRLLFAIPNGSFLGDGVKRLASGKTVSLGAIRSRKLKAEGVKTGVPDLCLPVARGGFHGLYIEMKRTQGGTLSPEQKQWHQDLTAQGYHVALCKGQPAAQSVLTTYLTLPKTQLPKASQAPSGRVHPLVRHLADAPLDGRLVRLVIHSHDGTYAAKSELAVQKSYITARYERGLWRPATGSISGMIVGWQPLSNDQVQKLSGGK